MNFTNLLTYALLFAGMILFLPIQEVAAQSTNYGYDKEEYDGEYDYENESYYDAIGGYESYSNRYAKRAIREEELYNGGYKRHANANDNTGYSQSLNLQSLPSNKRKQENTPDQQPLSPSSNHDWRNINNPSGTSQDHNPQVLNSDGTTDGGVKEVDPGEKDPESPPPPPDEPDVPVDTAIPFLLIGGIALVSYKFKLSRSL